MPKGMIMCNRTKTRVKSERKGRIGSYYLLVLQQRQITHYTVDPMLLPSGNPFKCDEEVLYFQLLIPPKRFDIFPPRLGDAQKV